MQVGGIPLQQGAPIAFNGMGMMSLPRSSSASIEAQLNAAAAEVTTPAEAALLREDKAGGRRKKDLTPEEKLKLSKERNKVHARLTRKRKKAYIQKLKELLDDLQSDRSEELKQRRVAIQHLAEVQSVRRAVVRSFLRFHAKFERDKRKWATILEDSFWFKQPVTPYRCFRRSEIQQECRIAKGVDAVIADAASLVVMVECVGSRSQRWIMIKREDFFVRKEERTGRKHMPRDIISRNGRYQHAVSSMSSSSGSSGHGSSGSSGEENRNQPQTESKSQKQAMATDETKKMNGNGRAQNVTASSGSSNGSKRNEQDQSAMRHEYHSQHGMNIAESERNGESTSEDSPEEGNNSGEDIATKRVSADSSSSDDSAAAIKNSRPSKRHKSDDPMDNPPIVKVVDTTVNGDAIAPGTASTATNTATHSVSVSMSASGTKTSNTSSISTNSYLPVNIAKKGGISHNIRPVMSSQMVQRVNNARLSTAPAIQLPPFAGIGKRPTLPVQSATQAHMPSVAMNQKYDSDDKKMAAMEGDGSDGTNVTSGTNSNNERFRAGVALDSPIVISGDVDTSSSNSSSNRRNIRAYYHVNEDDMILMDDVLMCPFVFRTQDAVVCGALAECIMPGMLRASFSARNQLLSVEMLYDAMGFMQQLERASGSEVTAQIIPGSLEMALSPTPNEARLITLAEAPYLIVNVNEAWTRMTRYTQLEVEGKGLFEMLQGEGSTEPPQHNLDGLSSGRPSCSTIMSYTKSGRELVNFICSFPLTNSNDEITHILHVCKELPHFEGPGFEEGSGGL